MDMYPEKDTPGHTSREGLMDTKRVGQLVCVLAGVMVPLAVLCAVYKQIPLLVACVVIELVLIGYLTSSVSKKRARTSRKGNGDGKDK